MGAMSRWVGYVGVDDIDAAADRFKRLGGAVYVPPTDSNIGRISVVADPQTATLALVKGLKAVQPERAELDELGRVGWHELLAADWKNAFAFYNDLFGWRKMDAESGSTDKYQLFSSRRTDDRRHVHQASAGADPVLAILFQCRGLGCGHSARHEWWRPSLRGTARVARQQLGCPVQGSSRLRIRNSGEAKPGCRQATRLVHRVGQVFIAWPIAGQQTHRQESQSGLGKVESTGHGSRASTGPAWISLPWLAPAAPSAAACPAVSTRRCNRPRSS